MRVFVDKSTATDTVIRRTKIVATLGPTTGTEPQIAALIDAGANVLRVNASHGTPELCAEWIAAARRVADAKQQPIAVLFDLQGPRIRVGNLAAPRPLTPGQRTVFSPAALAAYAELTPTSAGVP